MSELDFEMPELPSPEIIDLTIESAEENEIDEESGVNKLNGFNKVDGVKKLGEVQNSSEIVSDLEEGEIKEPCDSVCRHFRRGRCWLGKHCTFLHIGVNSYKMFDSQNSLPVVVYSPIAMNQPTEDPPDAWDKGLEEAKKLLLNAKLKKEADLDFEEKQLYQDLDEIISDKEFYRRKMDMADKLRKRRETSRDCPRLTNSERKPKAFSKAISKELPRIQKQEKMKSRTRDRRSNSWSPVPSRQHRSYSPNSSASCSECEVSCNDSYESEKDIRKTKSKLERVFSRTLYAPKSPRSRKKTTSRRTYSFYSRRRSLSRHSSTKRFLYRSYSKSPPPLKKRPEKNVPLHKQPTSPTPKRWKKYCSSSQKELSGSTFSKLLSQNNVHDLESCSSDMTVSSIKCTSVSSSCSSSKEKESTRRSKSPVSKRMPNDVEREHINSYTRDISKWLDTFPKSTKGNECGSKTPTKIVDRNKEKSSKPVENGKAVAKPRRKVSSCSSSEEDLSADELELLRYIPNTNRKKLGQEKKKVANNVKVALKTSLKNIPSNNDCGTNEENHQPKADVECPPPKIVYDYGSDTETLIPKLVPDYESDRQSSRSVGSNRKTAVPKTSVTPVLKTSVTPVPKTSVTPVPKTSVTPVPKTSVEHLSPKNVLNRETNGENHFPKESSNAEQVNDNFSKELNDAAQTKYPSTKKMDDAEEEIPKQLVPPATNKSKKRRSFESSVGFSEDELELLKYVSIGRLGVSSQMMRKKTTKNPHRLNAKEKTISENDVNKSSKCKSAGRKTSAMSRREQLMQQLEAVELAIAKRKQQAKLEYAKIRKKQKALS